MDWIDDYIEFTDGTPSPEIFRLWSAITGLAGALERRVWVETSQSVVYPHLYTLLVAPPGIGKTQAISPIETLWYDTQKLHVAPDFVTKAALIDALNAADTKKLINQELVEYNYLVVAAGEFGVLVPSHDLEFLNTLNSIYDAKKTYREERRSMAKKIEIINPGMTILAGTQPGYLAAMLPEEAWSMGFTSRLIMIYCGTGVRVPLFGEKRKEKRELRASLLARMKRLLEMHGPMLWEPAAALEMERWALEDLSPVPEHSKLHHYNSRRLLNILKLCIISTASRGATTISMADLERAREWLLHAETLMPDIFKAMAKKSDSEVISEIHRFVWEFWIKTKKSMPEQMLLHYVKDRTTSEKIDKMISITVRCGMLKEDTPMPGVKLYTPRPFHQHGME